MRRRSLYIFHRLVVIGGVHTSTPHHEVRRPETPTVAAIRESTWWYFQFQPSLMETETENCRNVDYAVTSHEIHDATSPTFRRAKKTKKKKK